MIRFLLFAVLLCVPSTALAQTTRPVPAIERVLIISIDGLRPDVLLRADAPRIRSMMDNGSFTMWAKTTASSITLPSHVSMLTGVVPEVHAILWNADLHFAEPVYPNSPTLFEMAKRAGYTTAMCAGKSKFVVFDKPAMKGKPAALDWKFITPAAKAESDDVTAEALTILREHKPQVMFVHLPSCDNVGHAKGWGTPEQLEAVADADRCVAKLLDLLEELKLNDSTLVIVTADHGGAGRTHGPEDPRSRTIPWIAVGPGVRKNFDLTRLGREVDVQTFDTFATACYVLGIKVDHHIDGKPLPQIFENQEMMLSTYEPKMAPATLPAR